MGKLDGKVAVITGGASGIGEASVRLFVEEGARVVIADVLERRGRPLAEELGSSAAFVNTDVRSEEQVQGAVQQAVERFGRLDCMFNNAGLAGVAGPIEETDLDGFDDTIAILLRGVVAGIKHAAPIMKKQGTGSIVNTASIAGQRAGFAPHIYSAAKAAVIHLTRTVAMELGESGVRVNCICPGAIATPLYGTAMGLDPEAAEQSVEIMKGVLGKVQPIQRPGASEDIALAALWLAGDDSTFVNGHALTVDGGLTGGRLWSQAQEGRALLRTALGADKTEGN